MENKHLYQDSPELWKTLESEIRKKYPVKLEMSQTFKDDRMSDTNMVHVSNALNLCDLLYQLKTPTEKDIIQILKGYEVCDYMGSDVCHIKSSEYDDVAKDIVKLYARL